MIFTPFIFKEKEFKNRLIMTAINTGFDFDYKSFDKIKEFYRERAKGGAAAITTMCAVEECGTVNNIPFNCESYGLLCNEISNILKEHNCKHIVQLFYYGNEFNITSEKIENIKENFIKTAKICVENGADAIEIDFNKGHIFSNFICSDISLIENNFTIEILRDIKNNIDKNLPIIINISLKDILVENIENSNILKFIKKVKELNVIDLLRISNDIYDVCEIDNKLNYIKYNIDIPVILDVCIHDEKILNNLINKDLCCLFGITKNLIADKAVVNKISNSENYNKCQNCNKCIENVLKNKEIYCPFNPEIGYEYLENSHRRIATAKKLVVVGGGVAGMMAAKKSADRGYKTILITNESRLGGKLNMKACMDYYTKSFLENLESDLKNLEVEIVYNTLADFDIIKSYEPYFVVLAMGSVQNVDEKFYGKNYVTAENVIYNINEFVNKYNNKKIVIVGEKTFSSDIANYIKNNGNFDITIIDNGKNHKYSINEFYNDNLNIIYDDIFDINENTIYINNKTSINYDCIIVANGYTSGNSYISERLMDERISYSIIGDLNELGNTEKSLKDGFELFLRLFIA